MPDRADFYAALPVFAGFASIVDPSVYEPLPDDWLIGLSDVIESTRAIEDGRYKVVNTAGAAIIAAVTNARERRDFPFAFGGDGATFALPGQDEALARAALAATAAWARDELAAVDGGIEGADPNPGPKDEISRQGTGQEARALETEGFARLAGRPRLELDTGGRPSQSRSPVRNRPAGLGRVLDEGEKTLEEPAERGLVRARPRRDEKR